MRLFLLKRNSVDPAIADFNPKRPKVVSNLKRKNAVYPNVPDCKYLKHCNNCLSIVEPERHQSDLKFFTAFYSTKSALVHSKNFEARTNERQLQPEEKFYDNNFWKDCIPDFHDLNLENAKKMDSEKSSLMEYNSFQFWKPFDYVSESMEFD